MEISKNIYIYADSHIKKNIICFDAISKHHKITIYNRFYRIIVNFKGGSNMYL